VSVVRNKAGKRVEFGLPYLLHRLGGGYVFGTLLSRAPDETKMPLHALAAYRERFGDKAVPELMVYDRGGYAKGTLDELAHEGVKQIGVSTRAKINLCLFLWGDGMRPITRNCECRYGPAALARCMGCQSRSRDPEQSLYTP
jgi:hypothetical protein